MSSSISITVSRIPRVSAVLDALGLEDVELAVELDRDASWPDGVLRMYRRGLSTRATEVHCDVEARVLTVRILALACFEDVGLAIALVRAFAACGGGAKKASSEAFGAIALGELGARYGDVWWTDKLVIDFVALRQALATAERVEVRGPRRTLRVGREMLARLRTAGDLLIALRKLQWHPYPLATVYEAKAASDGRTITIVLWNAEAMVIPEVDYVGVVQEGAETFLVKPATVRDIAGKRGTMLDEVHLAVDAFSPIEWAIVCTAAAKQESIP